MGWYFDYNLGLAQSAPRAVACVFRFPCASQRRLCSSSQMMKAREEQNAHFGIFEMGRKGGPNVPFMLSKIGIFDRTNKNNYPPSQSNGEGA